MSATSMTCGLSKDAAAAIRLPALTPASTYPPRTGRELRNRERTRRRQKQWKQDRLNSADTALHTD